MTLPPRNAFILTHTCIYTHANAHTYTGSQVAPVAAEVAKACKDGILMTICCYTTQQLVHQGPPSERERGVGKKRWWWQWERVG